MTGKKQEYRGQSKITKLMLEELNNWGKTNKNNVLILRNTADKLCIMQDKAGLQPATYTS